MNKEEMRRKIDEELKHIPRGVVVSDQNFFRSYYNGMRMTDLSQNSECPAKETFIRAVEAMKKNKPDFSSNYDSDFFNLWVVLRKAVKHEMGDKYRRSTMYGRS
ncbi:hypothetical protein ACFLVN_00620 [Chloroflexota bacterium]